MWSDGFERYTTIASNIFSAENKLKLQLKVEVTIAEVQEKLGLIPEGSAEAIKHASSKVTLKRVQAIENEIHHDLMAMVKALSENAGISGRYVHYSATSMDIQDTVLALQMKEAKKLLLEHGFSIVSILTELSKKYRNTPMVGRTHGQFAIPITLGFKFANYLYEFLHALLKFESSNLDVSKISGAVGTHAVSMRFDVEEMILKQLRLKPVPISTQVVTRLIHSEFMFHTVQISSVIERLAKEIRHLQRSEIREILESKSVKQVGSSAMPHKRNPHKTERLNGLARMLRANISVSFENIALEHERDLTNSAPERLVIPANVVLLHYMMLQIKDILEKLDINEERIANNLKFADRAKSEQVLTLLTEKVGRQKGHEILLKHEQNIGYSDAIMADPEILAHIEKEELSKIFGSIHVGMAPEKVDQIVKISEGALANYKKQYLK